VKRGLEALVHEGIRLERSQIDALEQYEGLLEERAIPLGLISRGDRGRVWDRHVVDSLRAAAVFASGDRSCYDLGSGAGLPGIPLAVALPHCRVVLVESRSKRGGFLELALEQLGLENARALVRRAEDLDDHADVVTTRAFGPAPRCWQVAYPLLRPGGRLVYFAGAAGGVAPGSLGEPAPAHLEERPVLATSGPLVIMTRG
jgi:16S rRNA (guanine527-N7)-methyltransferase